MSSRDHPVGDSRLMGPVSGLLWLTAGTAPAVCRLLPGTPDRAPALASALILLVVAYGARPRLAGMLRGRPLRATSPQ